VKIKKRFIFLGLILVLCGVIFFPALLKVAESGKIYSAEENIPAAPVALVFGAGLNVNGRPSDALADRLIVAAGLYLNGTVEKILVSGDNITDEYYNEPAAMKEFLVLWGIPEDAIAEDFAGARTYDSCLRAKEIWGIEEAVLVTQKFHLPRALFTCNALGVQSIGMIADRQPYVFEDYYDLREWFAVYKALLDLYIKSPETIGGEPETL
jgi:vancomycin permeability regulator SanA